MSAMLAIALREWASSFRTPVGWVVTALLCALGSVVVSWTIVVPGAAASLRSFFDTAEWLLLPVVPAISMKLLSDEHRSGTIDLVLASPTSLASLIAGKYLGGMLTLLTMLAPTLVYIAVLWPLAEPAPDAGPLASGYLALVLLGAVYLAVGLAASAATSSQTLAFLITLFVLLAWLILPNLRTERLPEWLDETRQTLALAPRVQLLARGAVPLSDVMFLVGAAATSLCLAGGIDAFRSVR